ncbi:MAG: hypothetical protein HY902_14930 [Deltaproteobacteria bacterium]|nr:hypothetical protein [Deltaproteobacteria bacterium]
MSIARGWFLALAVASGAVAGCSASLGPARTSVALGASFGTAATRERSLGPTEKGSQTHQISTAGLDLAHQFSAGPEVAVHGTVAAGRVTDADGLDAGVGRPTWQYYSVAPRVAGTYRWLGWALGCSVYGAADVVLPYASLRFGPARGMSGEVRYHSDRGLDDAGVLTMHGHLRGERTHLSIGSGWFGGRIMPLYTPGKTDGAPTRSIGKGPHFHEYDPGVQVEFQWQLDPSTAVRAMALASPNWLAGLTLVVSLP